jgi:hypothetical protein
MPRILRLGISGRAELLWKREVDRLQRLAEAVEALI